MLIKIILLVILIVINGIFSATEIAYLSLNKYDLHKELKKGNKKASKILKLINDSSSFLSAIQIAITLSGFLASAFAAENFASELAEIINPTNISIVTLTNILIIIITILLSFFTLVFGELIPKKLGLAYSKKIAFMMVNVINLVILFFKPFILILKITVDFFAKILHIKEKDPTSEDEVKNSIIDSSLEDFEKDLLLNVFEFNDTTVKEAMTKKNEIISIDIESTIDELFNYLRKYKYTRFPIEKNHEIIGFLNIKDLMLKNNKSFKISNYLRKLPKIASDMKIDEAFLYLRSKKEVIALVVENNNPVGIVTIEDIIEEVLGSIVDEYD